MSVLIWRISMMGSVCRRPLYGASSCLRRSTCPTIFHVQLASRATDDARSILTWPGVESWGLHGGSGFPRSVPTGRETDGEDGLTRFGGEGEGSTMCMHDAA